MKALAHIALACGLTLAGAAWAEAPRTAPRPEPRPVSGKAIAAAVAEAVAPGRATATAPAVSLRPLPRPRVASVSAAAPTAVVTVPAAEKPTDPITAFFNSLTGSRPSVAAPTAAASSTLAATTSPRAEARPQGLGAAIAAALAPRGGASNARGSVCGVNEIKGEKISDINGPGRCGVEGAVRVTSVAGVPLSVAPTIDCTTAKALNTWVKDGVVPAVGRTGGGLARLNVIAHYSCRTRNNKPGARLSEHSFGHAVDVSGVTLRDGTTLTVLEHWSSGRYGKIVKAMHSAACGPFGTVLGPRSDRYHQDHFHVDTARYRGGPYCK